MSKAKVVRQPAGTGFIHRDKVGEGKVVDENMRANLRVLENESQTDFHVLFSCKFSI